MILQCKEPFVIVEKSKKQLRVCQNLSGKFKKCIRKKRWKLKLLGY